MLRRPADTGPRLQLDVKIVGQDTQMQVVATVFAMLFARSEHPDRIARSVENKNSPFLRHGTLVRESQKYLRGAESDKHGAESGFLCGLFTAHASRFVLGDTARPRKTRIA
jgi:hypothetical protein